MDHSFQTRTKEDEMFGISTKIASVDAYEQVWNPSQRQYCIIYCRLRMLSNLLSHIVDTVCKASLIENQQKKNEKAEQMQNENMTTERNSHIVIPTRVAVPLRQVRGVVKIPSLYQELLPSG
jgi:hypothetical protein